MVHVLSKWFTNGSTANNFSLWSWSNADFVVTGSQKWWCNLVVIYEAVHSCHLAPILLSGRLFMLVSLDFQWLLSPMQFVHVWHMLILLLRLFQMLNNFAVFETIWPGVQLLLTRGLKNTTSDCRLSDLFYIWSKC